eukprot:CAMPEP_0194208610 /NCGR_PEP_ID=MMETSP0156-20130528/7013_1 /TAXON_ID=33649 /ORGANISM="Thalassionema nitzschioides, Strain L26-B" /LENGTH=234 /DNA_ID=CAMNT_0038935615 /DNA_START=57 /DNA_END=761 /DNA_ORIENTATION=-
MQHASKKPNRATFPTILFDIVSHAATLGVDNVISWDEEGSGFIIYDKKAFVLKILPKISKQSKYSSFRRQLTAYGFERVSLPGRATISYTHQAFRRDDPNACTTIRRQYARKKLHEEMAKLGSDASDDLILSSAREDSGCAQGQCVSSSLSSHNTPAAAVSEYENSGALVRSTRGHESVCLSDSVLDDLDLLLDEVPSMLDNYKSSGNLNAQRDSLQGVWNMIYWDPLCESLNE